MSNEKEIFKKGSTTYYWSSKFFPKSIRDDVFKLYSFVRVVDDMVDTIPAQKDKFNKIKKRWSTVKKQLEKREVPKALDKSTEEQVLKNIAYIVYRYDCDPLWVDSFLESMQMDLDGYVYENLDDSLKYVYGSAEVIGLFMSKIMRLPIAPYEYAKLQGRAMQWINFIRDIDEDIVLERCYFPKKTLSKYGLKDLNKETVLKNQKGFEEFVREQLSLYKQWQKEAYKGFSYIPKRMRVPLKTAVDMYNWTAQQIEQNPMIVYERQVKPTKQLVVKTAAKNFLNA